MSRRNPRERGVALVMVMLACVLLAAALAVMLDVGTAQLRRSVESARALQAEAGADAGTGWFRALLMANAGDPAATMLALDQTSGKETITLDPHTQVQVTVSLTVPGGSGPKNHNDVNLQRNQQILEQLVQLASTAVVVEDGTKVAQRTSTTLLRIFLDPKPYSEIVGVVDDAGPDAIDSPGDSAGQAAAANTTDLLVHAYTRKNDGPPNEVDKFKALQWADGNPGGGGVLP
jgi:type II secretory pathway component PulK